MFFDKIWEADESWLEEDILKYCFENKRGFGYWIWKSIIFEKVFSQIEDEDIADLKKEIDKKFYSESIELEETLKKVNGKWALVS